MKKDILKRIFEMSRIIQKIPQPKAKALYSEIVHEYMDKNVRTVDFDDSEALENAENRAIVSGFAKFMEQKLKFVRVVNCIPKDQTIDSDFEKVFPTEESIQLMSLDELIQPQTFLNIEKSSSNPAEENMDLSVNSQELSQQTQKKDPRLEEIEDLIAGKYYIKDGRLIKGDPDPRLTSQYSNWTAGNVDPEDLERHKKLLERQHYGGPFWEGKPKPKSIEEEMPEYVPEESPYGDTPVYMLGHKEGNHGFKKVRG